VLLGLAVAGGIVLFVVKKRRASSAGSEPEPGLVDDIKHAVATFEGTVEHEVDRVAHQLVVDDSAEAASAS
ncbi:MAG: DedA family protein, partial [Catenulispora sp.]